MSPLSSTAGAALAIHIPPPPPGLAEFRGVLHHALGTALPCASFEIFNATTHPGAAPSPSPPPNAITRALAPPGFWTTTKPARCNWWKRSNLDAPAVYPSILTDGNLSAP